MKKCNKELVLFQIMYKNQGGNPDFKWQGWSIEGKNQNPKKSPYQKINPPQELISCWISI